MNNISKGRDATLCLKSSVLIDVRQHFSVVSFNVCCQLAMWEDAVPILNPSYTALIGLG